jgi:hypothetical protein
VCKIVLETNFKERQTQLSASIQELSQQLQQLTSRIRTLELENKYLRGLIVESKRGKKKQDEDSKSP